MFTLPSFLGQYPVGAATFGIPLGRHLAVGSSKLKSPVEDVSQEPALSMDEIVFTVFYPADIPQGNASRIPFLGRWKSGMDWVARPVKDSLRGYARFGKIAFWIVNLLFSFIAPRLKIPVNTHAPLLDPSSASKAAWPLVFFSHGLGGTRTNYSQICTQLASQGRVVLAMEHRDGTGPATFSRSHLPGADGFTLSTKLYLNTDEVVWEDGIEPTSLTLRFDQLKFRQLEICLAHAFFSRFVETNDIKEDCDIRNIRTLDVFQINHLDDNQHNRAFWKSWAPESHAKVECSEGISLVGHSFGGATMLFILSNPPPEFPDMKLPELPVTRALILDPWLEPLSSPGPAPTVGHHPPQLCVINSEGFTLWKDHFERLTEVVRAWHLGNSKIVQDEVDAPARLLTIVRARHISFSDFGVLLKFGKAAREGRRLLELIGRLAAAFLDGTLDDQIEEMGTRKMEVEQISGTKRWWWTTEHKTTRRLVGDIGDLIVH